MAGKGDKRRKEDIRKVWDKFDKIDWSKNSSKANGIRKTTK